MDMVGDLVGDFLGGDQCPEVQTSPVEVELNLELELELELAESVTGTVLF